MVSFPAAAVHLGPPDPTSKTTTHLWHIQQTPLSQLFMHYTSFLNNLLSHLSIFFPLLPSVSVFFSSAWLKAFTSSLSPCLGKLFPHSTQFLSPFLYFFLFLCFFSIFHCRLASYCSVPSIPLPLSPLRSSCLPPS